MKTNEMLYVALDYTDNGWAVFPCHHIEDDVWCSCGQGSGMGHSPGKHPRTKNGVKDATHDEKMVRKWWREWPSANIGIATGAISGIHVVDVDVDDDKVGAETLATLEAEYGKLPQTVEVETGSGGRHLWFRYPDGVDELPGKQLGKNIDTRGQNGYVIAPPSNHKSGYHYKWTVSPDDVDIAVMPDWMVKKLQGNPKEAQLDSTPTSTQIGNSIDRLYLSKRIQGLIHTPLTTGQRSQADMSVVCALVGRGCSDTEIFEIYSQYPIGVNGKMADHRKPESYLQRTINKARAYVTDINPPEPSWKKAQSSKKIMTVTSTVKPADTTKKEIKVNEEPPILGALSTEVSNLDNDDEKCHHQVVRIVERAGDLSEADWAVLRAAIKAKKTGMTMGSIDAVRKEGFGGKAGRRKKFTADYIEKINNSGYQFRMNTLDDSVEVDDERMSEGLRATIKNEMRDAGFSPSVAEDVWMQMAYKNKYHPIQTYLDNLKWDGKDHFSSLVAYLQQPSRADIGMTFIRRWLIGSVAKIYEQAQNFMLVLDGPQNIGKSHFARWLCPLPSYFVEGPIEPDNKDSHLRLIANWIWEVGELQGTTRKADREALKAFITTKEVTIRPPYGRYDIVKPANASFIGTINESGSGFLNDPTGNRRFAVVYLENIDWDYTSLDISQLWAQIVHLYKNGETWNLTSTERKRQNEINQDYESISPVQEAIALMYEFNVDDSWTSSLEIMRILQKNGGLNGNQQQLAIQIAQAMTRFGIKKGRKRIDGRRLTGYVGLHLRDAYQVESDSMLASGFNDPDFEFDDTLSEINEPVEYEIYLTEAFDFPL